MSPFKSVGLVLLCAAIVLGNVSAHPTAKRLYREGRLARQTEVIDSGLQWNRVLFAAFRYRPWNGWILCHNLSYLLFGAAVLWIAATFRSR